MALTIYLNATKSEIKKKRVSIKRMPNQMDAKHMIVKQKVFSILIASHWMISFYSPVF